MSAGEIENPAPVPGQLGRYQILGKLGQGGMAEVYLAHDAGLDRRVALKLLPRESVHDPDAVARFRREARALAKLSHPGIVQAFDSDSGDGRHFLVMEYVEGHSLSALLKEFGRLPPALAADYARQVALALQHAHDKGLVHRDLKPANLLVTPQGQVKLLDLGLARFLQDQIGDSQLTREGAGMGTPDYCAPEQYRDARSADPRADIYSLGCTLYQMLAGRVPFPGSSLSEKFRAHADQEAQAVEESCPEVPVGLALVVRRMMAKRPQDRFRTAGEVAVALAPFVAGSSLSGSALKTVASWDGAQLTLSDFRASPGRRRRWERAGIAAAFVALLALLAWSLSRPVPDAPAVPARTDEAAQAKAGPASKEAPEKHEPAEPDDPNVLTVSRDGKARFRSIREALEHVDRPGMTVRVLDAGEYEEELLIDQKDRHAHLRLEAPHGATVVRPPGSLSALTVRHVPGVTVRGLRLRIRTAAGPKESAAVHIYGRSPGTRLEDLEVVPEGPPTAYGVILQCVDLPPGAEPVVVQGCRLRPGTRIGILVTSGEYQRAGDPCRRVILRNNQIEQPHGGVVLSGALERVHVVGNRIWGSDGPGIQFEKAKASTRSVLIANNTLFNCRFGLRFWDEALKGQDIQARNNLILASRERDVHCEGNGEAIRRSEHWKVASNWRDGPVPSEGTSAYKSWIPPEPGDVLKEEIEVVSRKPGDAGFLHPPSGSPLGTEGAGKADPSLPSYVGAVPPEGVERWDWQRTWLAPPPGKLLTVSQRPEDGGQYRTINDALANAEPWATVRVLDDATYREDILLDDPGRHKGLALESPRGATLEMTARSVNALEIRGVPDVRVTGLRLSDPDLPNGRNCVRVTGRVPGVTLQALAVEKGGGNGIVLQAIEVAPTEDPLVVRNCTLGVVGTAVVVVGEGDPKSPSHGGIALLHNRASGMGRGFILVGPNARVLVAGNLLWNCTMAALHMEDPGEGTRQVLFANNTAFESRTGFRLWNNRLVRPSPGQVEFASNLFFGAHQNDLHAVLAGPGEARDSRELAEAAAGQWRFERNWRDVSGTSPAGRFPLSPGDRRLAAPRFASRAPESPAFMRPAVGQKWALQGAGSFDPALPVYVGAAPPPGVEPWDWSVTWRARMRKGLRTPRARAGP